MHRPRSKKCPACGARDCARYEYGMPYYSQELAAQLDAGTVVLGGCILIEGEIWDWHCNVCELDFLKTEAYPRR